MQRIMLAIVSVLSIACVACYLLTFARGEGDMNIGGMFFMLVLFFVLLPLTLLFSCIALVFWLRGRALESENGLNLLSLDRE